GYPGGRSCGSSWAVPSLVAGTKSSRFSLALRSWREACLSKALHGRGKETCRGWHALAAHAARNSDPADEGRHSTPHTHSPLPRRFPRPLELCCPEDRRASCSASRPRSCVSCWWC